MVQKPLVAVKARIAELVTGQWVEQGNEPSAVMLGDGTLAARANVMGVVVDISDGETPSLMIDDGSERIGLRTFEPVPGIKRVALGVPVQVIGRPRKFGETRFLVPESIRVLEDPAWLEVRKRELAARAMAPAPKPAPQESFVEEEVVHAGSPLLRAIRSLDKGSGADVEEVLSSAKCTQADIERLLVRGEIFEISPGRLKVLE